MTSTKMPRREWETLRMELSHSYARYVYAKHVLPRLHLSGDRIAAILNLEAVPLLRGSHPWTGPKVSTLAKRACADV